MTVGSAGNDVLVMASLLVVWMVLVDGRESGTDPDSSAARESTAAVADANPAVVADPADSAVEHPTVTPRTTPLVMHANSSVAGPRW